VGGTGGRTLDAAPGGLARDLGRPLATLEFLLRNSMEQLRRVADQASATST